MTTAKQKWGTKQERAMDEQKRAMDEQKRATNGQFGSGSGSGAKSSGAHRETGASGSGASSAGYQNSHSEEALKDAASRYEKHYESGKSFNESISLAAAELSNGNSSLSHADAKKLVREGVEKHV